MAPEVAAGHRGGRALRADDVRQAVADVCVSHEWLSLGVGLPYVAACEAPLSSKYEAMVGAWLGALQPPRRDADEIGHRLLTAPPPPPLRHVTLMRPTRALGLKLKAQLCLGGGDASRRGGASRLRRAEAVVATWTPGHWFGGSPLQTAAKPHAVQRKR